MGFGFGVTDETFVVASLKPGRLSAAYLFGLIAMPVFGWNFGTVMGACISSMLPEALQNAMGIALYGMFIALIVPAARDSVHVLWILVIAVAVNCLLLYVPVFSLYPRVFGLFWRRWSGQGQVLSCSRRRKKNM